MTDTDSTTTTGKGAALDTGSLADAREGGEPDSEARQEIESRAEETGDVLASGPRAGNRAGALAFLALAIVIAGAVHFYMASNGGDSYLARLDADLLQHAELSLQAPGGAGRMALAPSWPLRLYERLRGDIALYAGLAAAAAYLWQLSARSRARRDAFLLHDSLRREVTALRERVAELEDLAVLHSDRDNARPGQK